MRYVRTVLGRFARKEDGAVAVIVLAVMLPLLVLIGGAVDLTVAQTHQRRLQNSVDTAASLGATVMRTDKADAERRARDIASRTYQNSGGSVGSEPIFEVSADVDNGRFAMVGRNDVPTTFLKLARINSIPITADSEVIVGTNNFEIAIVVDNSSSMRRAVGSLKTALDEFADEIERMQEAGDVSVSLVPYTAAVNVGSGYANADWIDHSARSPLHQQGFDAPPNQPVNRFDLFDDLGESWGGCVMARQGDDYALTDVAPDRTKPESLFVPMFAPDGPGDADRTSEVDGYVYRNSYLNDDGGVCSGPVAGLSLRQRQERVCKYTPASGNPGDINTGGNPLNSKFGPNWRCDVGPLQRLTEDMSEFRRASRGVVATGGTNTTEGLLWGWRTLSPKGPFADAARYDDSNVRKIMVVMADGDSNIDPEDRIGKYNGINWSRYTPYGPLSAGVFSSRPIRNKPATTVEMNRQGLIVCDKMKAEGIEIWSVGYALRSQVGREFLRACASGANRFLEPRSTSDLRDVFAEIARRVEPLRFTE